MANKENTILMKRGNRHEKEKEQEQEQEQDMDCSDVNRHNVYVADGI